MVPLEISDRLVNQPSASRIADGAFRGKLGGGMGAVFAAHAGLSDLYDLMMEPFLIACIRICFGCDKHIDLGPYQTYHGR